mmetsp:Transcript_40475/g.130121  ORF Transcript_40475/g.130121 Transcript_40475/m.130121 type:complete len:435 (-) Transcript_40475:138-1442(-)
MLQVRRIVRQAELLVELRGDHREAPLVAGVQQCEERPARRRMQHLGQPSADHGGDRHLRGAQLGVAVATQPQELVHLHGRARRGPREVEGVAVRLAAEVRDRDCDVLREVVAVAPEHPSRAAHRHAKLVARGRHREHRWHSKVAEPHLFLRLEGHDEAAARRVHVNAHLPPVRPVELAQHLAHARHRIVVSRVVVAEDADHSDGLVVHRRTHVLRAKHHLAHLGRDKVGLYVHVLEQLLPAGLVHGRDDQVRVHAPHLRLAQPVPGCVPLAPPELQRQAGEEARLGRPDGARAGMAAVLVEGGALGEMPQVAKHVERVVVQLERARVDGLIGDVDLETGERHLLLLPLGDHVDVRGGVEQRREVEQLVVIQVRLYMPSVAACCREALSDVLARPLDCRVVGEQAAAAAAAPAAAQRHQTAAAALQAVRCEAHGV